MAVFTGVTESDLKNFLLKYELGKLDSFQGISEGIQNTNFLLNTANDKYILTIYEDQAILDSLHFFFDFTEHLANKGLPCPSPIHSRDGKVLQEICGKPAAIVSFLDGKWPKTIKSYHCAEIGKYSALLHKAADEFKQSRINPDSENLLCHYNLIKEQGHNIDKFYNGLEKEILESHILIMSKWPKDLPSGVVHGDLFPDNTLFQDENLVGIIDFYFSHNYYYMSDLANSLTQWCFEPKAEFNITKAKSMISAYNKERELSEEELNALPVLAAGAAMKWFLTRLDSWFNPDQGAAILNPKDPLEQLEKLRFHIQVDNVSEYGFKL